ncbi:hypothetical protein DC415_12490 [Agrobacterium tumefaciens]|uniref:Uncharacterized protein n=1 Tax=Rhizobium rhizogenes TaxID=359 RepID=A0AA92C4J8_RHIRH|nr:hypothetical protein DC430_09000 [Rhizobium rhizogenes]PVE65750.1 hypothetical protein DC415_12490 [Agrobacterium tumefaciens]PVE75814.1 hypothetical protein DCP16_12490 [Sphingomonas sp. TPD3009]
MTLEDLYSRLCKRHPHFRGWVADLGPRSLAVNASFAVIDRWHRECSGDVDALYKKLRLAILEFNLRRTCTVAMPTRKEFAQVFALHLPMVLGISWQRIRDEVRIPAPGESIVRVKRSR